MGEAVSKGKQMGAIEAVPVSREDLREQKFIDAYIADPDHNAERAALAAGYSAGTARTRAYTWVASPVAKARVYEAIQKRLAPAVKKAASVADASAGRVIEEISKLAMFDYGELVKRREDGSIDLDAKGRAQIDWSKLKPEHTAAIRDISPNGRVSFYGKEKSLEMLARFRGLFAKDAAVIEVNITLEQLILMSQGKSDGEKKTEPQTIEHEPGEGD